jgi:hypothetical protein
MSKLEIFIYRDNSETPDRTISVPLSVLRLNPRLLPKDVSLSLERQGVDISEIAALQGVEGNVLDIHAEDARILVSITGSGEQAAAPPAPVQPPPAAPVQSPPPPEQPPSPPVEPAPVAESVPAAESIAPAAAASRKPVSSGNAFLDRLTTEFIATELGWRTGHDLIFAACVHMTLVDKQKTWPKDAIDMEIREASQFYKPFYSTNLDEYLQYLMKNGKLAIADNREYEITPSTMKYLEGRLTEEKLKKRMYR